MKNQLLSCLVLACAAPWTQAAAIITNLPLNSQLSFSSMAFATSVNVAAGFGMPGGSNYTLDSVRLDMTIASGFTSVDLSLFGGNSSAPSGAALLGFTNPAFTADGFRHTYVFTPSSGFTLNASSNYWIVLDGSGQRVDGLGWNGHEIPVHSGIATFLGQTQDASLPPTTSMFLFGHTLAFQVDATELTQGNGVPEPGTITLLGAGIAALAFLRRR